MITNMGFSLRPSGSNLDVMYDCSIQELTELDFGCIRFGRVWVMSDTLQHVGPFYVITIHGFFCRQRHIITRELDHRRGIWELHGQLHCMRIVNSVVQLNDLFVGRSLRAW
jgi:hypothetical protein